MINAERIDTDTADRTLAAGTDSGVSALGIDADVTEPTGTAAFDARETSPRCRRGTSSFASTATGSTGWPTGSPATHRTPRIHQDTFIRVFRSLQNYQPGTFEGWLHRITTNLFLDMVRRRNRIRMEALPEDYDRRPLRLAQHEQIYHDARLAPDLQSALDSLAPEFRAAVVLCDIEGLSYEEIGATLGVQAGYCSQQDPSWTTGAA